MINPQLLHKIPLSISGKSNLCEATKKQNGINPNIPPQDFNTYFANIVDTSIRDMPPASVETSVYPIQIFEFQT